MLEVALVLQGHRTKWGLSCLAIGHIGTVLSMPTTPVSLAITMKQREGGRAPLLPPLKVILQQILCWDHFYLKAGCIEIRAASCCNNNGN